MIMGQPDCAEMSPPQLADHKVSVLVESLAELDGVIAAEIVVSRLLFIIDAPHV